MFVNRRTARRENARGSPKAITFNLVGGRGLEPLEPEGIWFTARWNCRYPNRPHQPVLYHKTGYLPISRPCFFFHSTIFLWFPESKVWGTRQVLNTSGRVY